MNVQTNIPLKNYTTMRLGGNAHFLAEAHSTNELAELYQHAQKSDRPVLVLGGGSNMIVTDEGYDGMVILNRIPGFEVIDDNDTTTTIKIGSGEIWDSVVARTVEMNLTGIEAMSAIPGTSGAAPVQNIGAYGQEIADVLVDLEAYDSRSGSFVTLTAADCDFSYRHSIFRGSQQGRYAITSITIQLRKSNPQPPFYDSLQKYLREHYITEYTPATIRSAVIAIRADKLPDPAKLPNTGSFFKNAIISADLAQKLHQQYPDLLSYKMDDDHYKIPTGWLIEKAGLKGELLHGMRVHSANALVLVNESANGYADLATARAEIIAGVKNMFEITIEQEPLEITVQ